MELNKVVKYAGKKVYIVLKNGFEYTTRLPDVLGIDFDIIDKFNKQVSLNCDIISFIKEVGN